MAELIVEDGTGLPTANAYATVEEVDTILEVNIHSNWSLADPDAKVKLIIWASRVMDERIRWEGRKVHETGARAWPRSRVRDKEGFLIPDDVVPNAVKVVCAYMADFMMAGDPEAFNGSQTLTSLKADVIELKFDTKLRTNKYPEEIKLALADLGRFKGLGGPKYIVMH